MNCRFNIQSKVHLFRKKTLNFHESYTCLSMLKSSWLIFYHQFYAQGSFPFTWHLWKLHLIPKGTSSILTELFFEKYCLLQLKRSTFYKCIKTYIRRFTVSVEGSLFKIGILKLHLSNIVTQQDFLLSL